MSDILPPNPSLLAILLIVKTASEPRLVFHYPPKPGEDNARYQHVLRDATQCDTSTSTDDESRSSGEDPAPIEDILPYVSKTDSPPYADEVGSVSPEKRDAFPNTSAETQWNDLFGYKANVLAKLLCPAKNHNKRRMELGLNNKVFLGQPIFAGPNGEWRKRKPRRTSSRSTAQRTDVRAKLRAQKAPDIVEAVVTEEDAVEDINEDLSADDPSDDLQGPVFEPGRDDGHVLDNTAMDVWDRTAASPEEPQKKQNPSLYMFQVSFVLNPPPLEHHLRVKEMYDNVAKKLTKALRWEQARSEYVAREASIITSIVKRLHKASGKTPNLTSIYQEVISQSALATAIAGLFNSLSTSRIAHVNLTATTSLSLQIPVPTSLTSLPSLLSPQRPGLWLTTATILPSESDLQMTGSQLGSQFGLLLLTDLRNILTDIDAAGSPIALPLGHYLRSSKPSKSFHQISMTSGIPLQDIQFLASHLIYWRRARAIPPLNKRDIYIVSPNADMQNLVSAASAFAKTFPSLPSLPKFLGMLSTTPRPYATLIPSKDHKEAYLEILAWLMRGGWVTQLRTFAWVRVPPHIMTSVDRMITTNGYVAELSNGFAGQNLIENNERDRENATSRSPSSASSTSTTVPTVIPSSAAIITNPRLPSPQESRYLSAISEHVQAFQGDESRLAWDKCLRYFDGQYAMETIAILETWKKKRIVELIADWLDMGILLRNRHW